MFIWIIEIIPSEFHGPVHASFRVDHSNRYRGIRTHTLSLSYRGTRLRRSGNNWLADGRMCITVTNVVIVIDNDWFATVRTGSSRGGLVVRASFESSRHDNPIVYVGNAALIHPPAYNRALCFRLTSLTFKSTLLGSTRLSCFANLFWKLESIKRS